MDVSDTTRKLRKQARTWVTKGCTIIKGELAKRSEDVDFVRLQDACALLEDRLNTLDEAQKAYELELDDEAVDEEVDSAYQFRSEAAKKSHGAT